METEVGFTETEVGFTETVVSFTKTEVSFTGIEVSTSPGPQCTHSFDTLSSHTPMTCGQWIF